MTKIFFPTTDKSHSKRLITSLAVVVVAVMSLLGYLIWSGYWEAKHEAETKTLNYAAIIDARLDATLRRADADLQQLARTIPIAALSRHAVSRYARELGAEMESHLINFPEMAALRIFDANGDRLYTTGSETTARTHISDRSYFRLLRDNPQAGLVFSELLISRSRDRPSVVAAKALRDGKGAFRGIVLAAIELDYFQKLFQSLDLGAHGVVSIYRSDNFTPVVRWPAVEGKINTPLPPGNPARAALARGIKTATLEFSSSTDDMVRIYSFNVLDRYPFFVTVGLAREDVLAGWRKRAVAVGLSGLLLLALLAGLLYWLLRAEAALKANEELMRTTFEQAAVGIAHIAPGTYHILMANDKFCDLLGYTQDELIGMDSRLLTPPDDMPARENERAQVMAGKIKTSSSERPLIRKDGALLWINRSLSLARDRAGQPQYFISVIEDITERKRAEQLLTLEHTVARSLANATSASAALIEVIRSICDTQGWECGRYLLVDEPAGVLRFSECWHMPGEAIERFVASKRDAVFVLGAGLAGRAWQSGQPAWIADIRNAAGSLGAAATLETGMHCAFHFPVISEGKVIGVLAFNSRKVREPDDRLLQAVNVIGSQIGQFLQRKQAEERIRYLATYDTLTGLPNRNMFHDRLTLAIARARRSGQMTALMFLDLDGFKEINDALGHAAGDQVLQATAGLLGASLRDVDTISRHGGDEFTVVLENITDVRQVKIIVEKIKEAFSAPIITQEGRDIFVTASIGIALYPLDADNIDALLQAADVAMYRAKQKGRNAYEFYASELKAQTAS